MEEKIIQLIKNGGSKEFEIINNEKIFVERGQFWTQKQRQGHSLHFVNPYQACFAPQIPRYFIEQFSEKGDFVLDTFCGRGTTILEANCLGRKGIGTDSSPLATFLSKAKLKNVTYEEVEKRLNQIDFSKNIFKGYKEFKDIYDQETYSQLINLKEQLKNTSVDNLIKSIILGRLHGHSKSFFSVWTFNVISFSKERIKEQSQKRGIKPEFRDVKPRILLKAKTILRDPIPEQPLSKIYPADSRKLKIETGSIDLIVTSPPFLNIINYIDDNWLRFWFLDVDREELRKKIVQTANFEEYKKFIEDSMFEMNRVLKKGKYCIIEVGDVKHNSKKIYLDHVIASFAKKTGFKIEKIMINYMQSPKISKAFSRKNHDQGTQTNRCVIMKKI